MNTGPVALYPAFLTRSLDFWRDFITSTNSSTNDIKPVLRPHMRSSADGRENQGDWAAGQLLDHSQSFQIVSDKS